MRGAPTLGFQRLSEILKYSLFLTAKRHMILTLVLVAIGICIVVAIIIYRMKKQARSTGEMIGRAADATLNVHNGSLATPSRSTTANARLCPDQDRTQNDAIRSEARLRDFDLPQPGQPTAPAVLDVIEIPAVGGARRIELHRGNLTDLPTQEMVDVLIVPLGYSSLTIDPMWQALERAGIPIEDLRRNRYIDLSDAFSCWLSHELPQGIPGIRFKRLLCYENSRHIRDSSVDRFGTHPPASAAVRDLFRALAPFVAGEPHVRSVAVPLMAIGAHYPVREVLPLLLETSVEWLNIGMPIEAIQLYGCNAANLTEAQRMFAERRAAFAATSLQANAPRWHAFISYAREDSEAALSVAGHLKERGFNVFVDQLELEHGAAWQQEIFDVLDNARLTVSIYSPDYVRSKVCLEEFNIAWARNREASVGTLFPIYWRSSRLPTYMRLLNYADCRERDDLKLEQACGLMQDRLKRQDLVGGVS
jgi:hypothetical protein